MIQFESFLNKWEFTKTKYIKWILHSEFLFVYAQNFYAIWSISYGPYHITDPNPIWYSLYMIWYRLYNIARVLISSSDSLVLDVALKWSDICMRHTVCRIHYYIIWKDHTGFKNAKTISYFLVDPTLIFFRLRSIYSF